MLDTDTYKKLQEKMGANNDEVGQVSASFALQGGKAIQTINEFLSLISQRNIPNTIVTQLKINNVVFYIVEKTIEPNEKAITAVRIEAYGNDLLVSIHHFEASQESNNMRLIRGNILLWGGIMFFWTGVGLVAIVIGLGFLASKSRFGPTTARGQSSLQHNQIVTETLLMALNNCEVGAGAQLKPSLK